MASASSSTWRQWQRREGVSGLLMMMIVMIGGSTAMYTHQSPFESQLLTATQPQEYPIDPVLQNQTPQLSYPGWQESHHQVPFYPYHPLYFHPFPGHNIPHPFPPTQTSFSHQQINLQQYKPFKAKNGEEMGVEFAPCDSKGNSCLPQYANPELSRATLPAMNIKLTDAVRKLYSKKREALFYKGCIYDLLEMCYGVKDAYILCYFQRTPTDKQANLKVTIKHTAQGRKGLVVRICTTGSCPSPSFPRTTASCNIKFHV